MLLSAPDASFYVSLCQEDNMTIPVLARLWTAYPSKEATSTLNMIFQPSDAVTTRHLNAKPSQRPTKAFFIKRFYLGIDPSSPPGKAVAKTATKIVVRHLSDANSDFTTLAGEMRLLEHLVEFSVDPAKGEDTEFELSRAVRRSEKLWRAVFGLLRRVVKKSFRPDQKWDMDKFRAMLRRNDWKGTEGDLFLHFVSMWRKLAWRPTVDKIELEAVVETMTRAGLFDTLDDTIYALIQVPGITQLLTIIFQSLIDIVVSSPALLELLEGEFPRANTLFALFPKGHAHPDYDWRYRRPAAPTGVCQWSHAGARQSYLGPRRVADVL
ncbi:hypothetical protein BDZ89DRAFT_822401 [Hymenopellis radicata]|nr:hypothetical protein BDZ89DRAFT_822401 [Hymenopellis radicata]